MRKKLTPWFPMSVNPARAGCYLIQGTSWKELPFPYHYFNGDQWEFDADDKPFASRKQTTGQITYAGGWRGLAKKP